jgi:hypothetical protein
VKPTPKGMLFMMYMKRATEEDKKGEIANASINKMTMRQVRSLQRRHEAKDSQGFGNRAEPWFTRAMCSMRNGEGKSKGCAEVQYVRAKC